MEGPGEARLKPYAYAQICAYDVPLSSAPSPRLHGCGGPRSSPSPSSLPSAATIPHPPPSPLAAVAPKSLHIVIFYLANYIYIELKLSSLAKVKEEALMALSVRKLIERGWLTALLGYLAKREELSVRLKYIGDVRLRRTDFGALAISTYYASKCWPRLPEDLAKTGRLLKPQEAPLWLVTALSLASYACRLQASGNRVSIDVSPERVGLEVNGVPACLQSHCVNAYDIAEVFAVGLYEVPEALRGP